MEEGRRLFESSRRRGKIDDDSKTTVLAAGRPDKRDRTGSGRIERADHYAIDSARGDQMEQGIAGLTVTYRREAGCMVWQ